MQICRWRTTYRHYHSTVAGALLKPVLLLPFNGCISIFHRDAYYSRFAIGSQLIMPILYFLEFAVVNYFRVILNPAKDRIGPQTTAQDRKGPPERPQRTERTSGKTAKDHTRLNR